MMKKILLLLPLFPFLLSCSSEIKVDLLIYNAVIYTVDSSFSTAEAIAVSKGKIIEVGKTADLQKRYDATEKLDAQGKFLYPGFIDAHAHFMGYGNSLQRVDLTGTNSWDEVIQRTKQFAAENPAGWLLGRGWDQNDWPVKNFPSNEKLNELFPDRPVLLTRVDGHAAIANQKALDIAGIRAGDKLTGGDIESKNGKLTGILVDNATDLAWAKIPDQTAAKVKKALLDAQKNCFAVGLTTVNDCGLDYETVLFIDSIQKTGDLKMRIYAMLSDASRNFDFAFSKGKIKTDHLHVCAF